MMYTAAMLREILKDVPDDTMIVMSSDAEGNRYSRLAQVDVEPYRYDGSPYWGQLFDPTDPYYTPGHPDFEEEIPPDAVPCVVLVPVN